ncbi:MAG: diaminopimelate epimerase [Planctomycetota bacterium]
MKFTKLHGLGNDYVFVDLFVETVDDRPGLARAVSDRHRGVGSDGLILIGPSGVAEVRMEVYNADGSRARMCGNGIRCVAKYAYEHGLAANKNPLGIETDVGVLEAKLEFTGGRVSRVRVDMGRPSLDPRDLPSTIAANSIIARPMEIGGRTYEVTCVSMGNPHAVVFVEQPESVDLESAGPLLERAAVFPDRINVHFVRADSQSQVTMRTWERGSGATQACGTGACAACVAGAVTGRTQRLITANLPGGDLQIEWAENDHVYMTGPAVEVFQGEWPTLGTE